MTARWFLGRQGSGLLCMQWTLCSSWRNVPKTTMSSAPETWCLPSWWVAPRFASRVWRPRARLGFSNKGVTVSVSSKLPWDVPRHCSVCAIHVMKHSLETSSWSMHDPWSGSPSPFISVPFKAWEARTYSSSVRGTAMPYIVKTSADSTRSRSRTPRGAWGNCPRRARSTHESTARWCATQYRSCWPPWTSTCPSSDPPDGRYHPRCWWTGWCTHQSCSSLTPGPPPPRWPSPRVTLRWASPWWPERGR